MPTYEYECKICGHTFEMFQSMSAKPVRRCPKCGKVVRRLMGAGGGIIFKGSGFYETDYKRKTSIDSSKKIAGDNQSSSNSKDKSSSSNSPKKSEKSEKN